VKISAHEGGHTLAPGNYKVTVQAINARGHATAPAYTTLKIVS
jgi:predicted phage tail protein